jgi:two-component system response regulator HydG
VLVIDDDAAHAESLGEALASFGYVPRVVHSGKEGLAALAAEEFDLVLTDLRMAGVDGMQILAAARRKDDTEVVVITGYGSVESAVDAMRAGAAHYVTKPVNLAELREVLTRIVEKQRLARRNTELEAQLDERYLLRITAAALPCRPCSARCARCLRTSRCSSRASPAPQELVARALHQNSRRRHAPS